MRDATLILAMTVSCLALTLLAGCGQPVAQPNQPVQYGPPVDAPTIDYEAMVGVDPLSQQISDERERNNDLQWRVERLERQVRDLAQITYGIRELRIGEMPPVDFENPDCECENCTCDDCKCTPENPRETK